jgi:hypothetical protein
MPKLSDLTLDSETTYNSVVTRWGKPRNFGPADGIRAYYMDDGDQLWLTFSAPDSGTLLRAIVVGVGPAPVSRVLFDAHPLTNVRRCSQLDFAKLPTAAQVSAAWGPPDNVIGSGIDNWIYRLADGKSATLVFAGGQVVNANGCSR